MDVGWLIGVLKGRETETERERQRETERDRERQSGRKRSPAVSASSSGHASPTRTGAKHIEEFRGTLEMIWELLRVTRRRIAMLVSGVRDMYMYGFIYTSIRNALLF